MQAPTTISYTKRTSQFVRWFVKLGTFLTEEESKTEREEEEER